MAGAGKLSRFSPEGAVNARNCRSYALHLARQKIDRLLAKQSYCPRTGS